MVRRPNVHHCTKFVTDRKTVWEIWPFFDFLKMAAICHLGFFTCVWTTHEEYLVVFVTVQNVAGIGH